MKQYFICNSKIDKEEDCEDCFAIAEEAKILARWDFKGKTTARERAFANLIVKLLLERGTTIEGNVFYG